MHVMWHWCAPQACVNLSSAVSGSGQHAVSMCRSCCSALAAQVDVGLHRPQLWTTHQHMALMAMATYCNSSSFSPPHIQLQQSVTCNVSKTPTSSQLTMPPSTLMAIQFDQVMQASMQCFMPQTMQPSSMFGIGKSFDVEAMFITSRLPCVSNSNSHPTRHYTMHSPGCMQLAPSIQASYLQLAGTPSQDTLCTHKNQDMSADGLYQLQQGTCMLNSAQSTELSWRSSCMDKARPWKHHDNTFTMNLYQQQQIGYRRYASSGPYPPTSSPTSQLRFSNQISECDSLNDLLDLWRDHGVHMRTTHKALATLRAAVLQQQCKFQRMHSSKAVQMVCKLQEQAVWSLEVEQCTFDDLRNMLNGWVRSGFKPPVHTLKQIVHKLKLPAWALPQPLPFTSQHPASPYPSRQAGTAAITGCISSNEDVHVSTSAGTPQGKPDGSQPTGSEVVGVQLGLAWEQSNRLQGLCRDGPQGQAGKEPGGKLRAATLDDLAVVMWALRALDTLDAEIIWALQHQIQKRAATGGKLESCARLAHEMSLAKCDDPQVYSALAMAATRTLQSHTSTNPPSPSDHAWILSALSRASHPDTRLLSASADYIMRDPGRYTPHAPRLVVAYALAGASQHQMFMEVMGSLIAKSTGSLDIPICGQISMAYASLGWAPDALLAKISQDTLTNLTELNWKQQATAIKVELQEAKAGSDGEDSESAGGGVMKASRLMPRPTAAAAAAAEGKQGMDSTLVGLVQVVHGMWCLGAFPQFSGDLVGQLARWLMLNTAVLLNNQQHWRAIVLLLNGCTQFPLSEQSLEVFVSTSQKLATCFNDACANTLMQPDLSTTQIATTTTPAKYLEMAYLGSCLLPLIQFQAQYVPVPASPGQDAMSDVRPAADTHLHPAALQVLQACVQGDPQGSVPPLSYSMMCVLLGSVALLDLVDETSWPLVAACLQRLRGSQHTGRHSGVSFWSNVPVQGTGSRLGPSGGPTNTQLLHELLHLPEALDAAVTARAKNPSARIACLEPEGVGAAAYQAVVAGHASNSITQAQSARAHQEPLKDEDLIGIYQCFLACELRGMSSTFTNTLQDDRLLHKASKAWGAMMAAQQSINNKYIPELSDVLNQLSVPILDPREEENLQDCPVPVPLLVWHEGRLIALDILHETLDRPRTARHASSSADVSTGMHGAGVLRLKQRILAARGVHLVTIPLSLWLTAGGAGGNYHGGRHGSQATASKGSARHGATGGAGKQAPVGGGAKKGKDGSDQGMRRGKRRAWLLDRQSLVSNLLRDAARDLSSPSTP